MKNNTIYAVIMAVMGISAVVHAVDPGFSLHNKSNGAIAVVVDNGTSTFGKLKSFIMTEADTVLKDRFFDKQIDLSKKTTLSIFDKNGNAFYKAEFPLNKTIYVNWDGTKLYHQRGPLKGLTGKTDAGYSLKNNVKDIEIRSVKP